MGPELVGQLAQRIQHIFFFRRLTLLIVDDIARLAVARLQAQHVPAAKICNGTFEDGGAGGSFADFAGDLRGEVCIPRLPHEQQSPPDARVGDDAEERRLLELSG